MRWCAVSWLRRKDFKMFQGLSQEMGVGQSSTSFQQQQDVTNIVHATTQTALAHSTSCGFQSSNIFKVWDHFRGFKHDTLVTCIGPHCHRFSSLFNSYEGNIEGQFDSSKYIQVDKPDNHDYINLPYKSAIPHCCWLDPHSYPYRLVFIPYISPSKLPASSASFVSGLPHDLLCFACISPAHLGKCAAHQM